MADLVLYVWGNEERNSNIALNLARNVPNVHVVNVKELTLAEIPKWLDGVPTLVSQSTEAPEVFYGTSALELLKSQAKVPRPQQQEPTEPRFGDDMPQHLRYIRPSLPEAKEEPHQPHHPPHHQPHQQSTSAQSAVQGAAYVFGKQMDVLETNASPRMLDRNDEDMAMSSSDMQANIKAMMKRRQALFEKQPQT